MGIKSARLRAGKTQEEVAKQFGVSQSTIVGWEQGRWMPNTARLMQIAHYFGCTVDELLREDKGEN